MACSTSSDGAGCPCRFDRSKAAMDWEAAQPTFVARGDTVLSRGMWCSLRACYGRGSYVALTDGEER